MTLIDWRRAAELRRDIGPADFAEVIELFLIEVEETLARLGPAPQGHQDDFHFLKGAAMNLGFAEFGALCQAAEQDCARARKQPDLAGLRHSYARSREYFLREVAGRFAYA